MTPAAAPPEHARGLRHLGRGRWEEARRALDAGLERAPEGEAPAWVAEAWDGAALSSYWLDDPERALEAQERAFRAWKDRGDSERAARAALWLADTHLTFRGAAAVANGWIERAASLLDPSAPSPALSWLHTYRGHYALMVEHDPAGALAEARRALDLAHDCGAEEAAMVALALEGLALVCAGRVEEGMPRLDEASATAVGREFTDLNAVAWSCCYLIHGCESIRDFERAEEWCERVSAFCERWGLRPIFGSCRTHYASVLTFRGHWREAETVLESTMSEARTTRPSIVRAGAVRLAELERRRGDLDGAERRFRDAAGHPYAVLGLASVALDRDEAREALEGAERFLRKIPPHARTERVEGLTVLARAAAALGEAEALARAADELEDLAESVATEPVAAAAALARGLREAESGRTDAARRSLEDAVDLYQAGGCPFEAAVAREALAEALDASGRGERGVDERRLAAGAYRALGAEARAARVEATEDAHRSPVGAGKGSAVEGPLSDRELEVLTLVARGLTNAETAERLFLSPHTVKRHMANILVKLGEPTRAAAVARGLREGWLMEGGGMSAEG